MAFTQAQLDALKAAYATGVRSVTFGDRTTTYASMDEMAKAIARIETEIARTATTPRPRQFRGCSDKGW
jgi:hypothetical protein